MKSSKSCGIDGLDAYSLKIAAEHIAPALHHITTLSIMQCRFPTSWKQSKVIPLHKKQSKLEPKNYRPVSILSPLSKVVERVIYDQVYNYFSDNNLFHPSMNGFRKRRSTLTALLEMYERWVQSANDGKINGILLGDLSAAFDLVSADILLKKLEIYGVDKCMLEWIKSYMTDRKQAVWIDNSYSNYLDVNIGVPQGSIIGPLMFIIFANDLPYCVTCGIDSYADDSSLTSSKHTIQEINEDLTKNGDNLSQWMKENQLCLNADKTHILVTGTGRRLSGIDVAREGDVRLEGQKLEESLEKAENILGVIIQSDLKWTKQVQSLRTKLKHRLAGLAKIRNIVCTRLKKQIAEGIFTSVLTYCLPLYGGMDKDSLHSLQVLQNVAARHTLNVPMDTSRKSMYDQLDWLTVNQLEFYHSVLMVYKIIKFGEPEQLATKLTRFNIRGNIIIDNSNLTLYRKSFSIRASEYYNSLPNEVRNAATIDCFKRNARCWIVKNVPRFKD